jgi:DNA-directed RNA polymerase specialized sigma subunit
VTDEELIEELRKRSLNKRTDVFIASTVDDTTTYKDAVMLKKKLDTKISEEVHKHQSDTLRPRFDTSMLYDALSYQLTNKALPPEVFQHIQELYKMSDDWLKIAKHTNIKESDRKDISKQLYTEKYPVIEEVDSKGLSVKGAICNSKTPTQQIRTVSKYITLSDRVDELERKVEEMDKHMETIDLRQTITDLRLHSLEQTIQTGELSNNPTKVLALKLREEGKTQKEIADILGVTKRTIIRWCKEGSKI